MESRRQSDVKHKIFDVQEETDEEVNGLIC